MEHFFITNPSLPSKSHFAAGRFSTALVESAANPDSGIIAAENISTTKGEIKDITAGP
jgi:hypothetical protein